MNRLLALVALSLLGVAAIGCAEKSSSTTTTKQTGPGGTTTTESKDTVKQSGENPPAAKP